MLSRDIDAAGWESVKEAEEGATGGGGSVGKGKAREGANPFFTFVLADDKCVAARGRGGGLAVWRKVADAPVAAQPGAFEQAPLDK